MDIRDQIRDFAKNNLKIDAVGFAPASIAHDDLINYNQYIQMENYGNMQWMKKNHHLRQSPKSLLPSVQSVIVLGFNYYDGTKTNKDYEISMYANQKIDYHKWAYSKIKDLAKFLQINFNDTNRFFVDSAPILEKALAKQTSIGWQGKHTCIVSREFGNWLFLGVLLTSLDIKPDNPSDDFCGTCTKCIDACPTGALSPYKIDVSKCLSYLTIEHGDIINELFFDALGNMIFGCDKCLQACHFNKWQKQASLDEIYENENYPQQLKDFLLMSEDVFLQIFKNTPIKRTGYLHILQNALIVVKNSGKVEFLPYLESLLNHENYHIKQLSLNVYNHIKNL